MTTIIAERRAEEARRPSNGTRSLAVVSASILEPSANRSRSVLFVDDCPHCPDGRHVHFLDVPVTAAERRAGCGRGRYLVQVTGPRPAVASALDDDGNDQT